MKQAVFASLAAVVFASGAQGADMIMPVKTPPVGFSWSGFYLGAHVGYAWQSYSTSTFDDNNGGQIDQFTLKDNGFFGGGQIGYNWVIAPNWLLGFEADASGAGLSQSLPVCSEECVSYRFSDNDFGTGRARLGYFWNNVLLYATGGWAWTDVKVDRFVNSSATNPALAGLDAKGTGGFVNGWAVGGGLEWGFALRWTARVEYLHLEFPSLINNYNYATSPATTRTTTTVLGDDIVRFGINYLFGP